MYTRRVKVDSGNQAGPSALSFTMVKRIYFVRLSIMAIIFSRYYLKRFRPTLQYSILPSACSSRTPTRSVVRSVVAPCCCPTFVQRRCPGPRAPVARPRTSRRRFARHPTYLVLGPRDTGTASSGPRYTRQRSVGESWPQWPARRIAT